jgi:hypothetical protein
MDVSAKRVSVTCRVQVSRPKKQWRGCYTDWVISRCFVLEHRYSTGQSSCHLCVTYLSAPARIFTTRRSESSEAVIKAFPPRVAVGSRLSNAEGARGQGPVYLGQTVVLYFFVAFSPQANYTDCATATCWRNLVPTFVDRGVSRGQRDGTPTVVNLSFLDRSRYFSFK